MTTQTLHYTPSFNAGTAYHDHNTLLGAFMVAAMVAFLMSCYFIAGYLAGSIHFWNWTIDQTLNGIVAIGLTGVMTAFQFFLYSKSDVQGGKLATVFAVCVAAGFSLLSEIGQGMERDNIRMESKSLESPTYKALVSQLDKAGNITASPYSIDLQQAQARLNGCLEKLRQGQVDNCVHSQGRVDAVRQMISDYQTNQSSHSLAMVNAAKNMERDENNYHSVMNLIRHSFNTTGLVASFILSLTIILFFEYAFHYLGKRYAEARDVLRAHGYDTTRRARATPRILGSSSASSAAPQYAPNLSPTPSPQPSAEGQAVVSEALAKHRAQPSAEGQKVGAEEVQLPLLQHETEEAWEDWLEAVKAGELSPTIKPTCRYISKRELVGGIKSIESLAYEWLARAEREGLIKNNPEGGIGKSKYILA